MIKHLLLILSFSSAFVFASSNSTEPKRDSIVHFAQSFLKAPYLWGGVSPKGFDCSGFLYYVYRQHKINVSRTSSSYAKKGTEVNVENSKPADVLLFTGSDSNNRKIGHVGMVISNINGIILFIHASSSRKHYGVTITKYNNSGYVKRFLKAISIL
jgi:cell wall-associated NlpC family hydrolase